MGIRSTRATGAMQRETEGYGATRTTRSGRTWRVVVGLLVVVSLMTADPWRWDGTDGSAWSLAAGGPSGDVDGGDGDPVVAPASALIVPSRRVGVPACRRDLRPGTPRGALVARHLADCGVDSCSGTTLPPPSSS